MALKREADEKCGLCGAWPSLVLFDDGSIAGVSHNFCPKWKPGLGPPDPPRTYTRGAYFPQHDTDGRSKLRAPPEPTDKERLDWLACHSPCPDWKPLTSLHRGQIDALMRAGAAPEGSPPP